MLSFINQPAIWCHPPSPSRKALNSPIFTSALPQYFPEQGLIENDFFNNDPLPRGIAKAVLYSSDQYLVHPQNLFAQNNTLSDPEVHTVSSSSDNGYPSRRDHRLSFSSQGQDYAYSIYDASSPCAEPAIDPNLVYSPESPDAYGEVEESSSTFQMPFNSYSWPAQMHYSYDTTQYPNFINSPTIYSQQAGHNVGYQTPPQNLESWQSSSTVCDSSHQVQRSSCNTNYPQTRRHSRRSSFNRRSIKREGSTSSNEEDRKPIRTKGKATKKQRPQHICHECPKERGVFRNKSELRKHRETQHTKPYYCFFKYCGKNFGARNEWKRHITTQHLQLDTWKCNRTQCADKPEFNRKDLFVKHLERMHKPTKISGAKWKDECVRTEQKCKRPRSPPQSCTCGYCGTKYENGDLSWNQFIDHVGIHYQNGDECAKEISDWKEDRNLTQWCADHGMGIRSESSEEMMDDDSSETCSLSDCIKREDSDSDCC